MSVVLQRGADTVEVRAHAKLNLMLHVLARESSGYHSIETLFQRIALHDDVRVQLTEYERVLTCTGPAIPPSGLGPDEDNLAWRAAQQYTEACAWATGWRIDIVKRIPVGGGLGGGSANAAGVLRALERLSPRPLGEEQLLKLGAQLGADVPFMLTGWSRALAWSRGERLLRLMALPRTGVTLVAFESGVDTAAAYQTLAAARNTQAYVPSPRAIALNDIDTWMGISKIAANDFEVFAMEHHVGVREMLPKLRSVVGHLRHGFAGMSGSGATCFAIHDERERIDLEPMRGCTILRTTT